MKFVLPFLFLTAASVFAAPYDGWSCKTNVQKLTKDWKSSSEWEKFPLSGMNEHFYGSPTKKVGEWILIRKKPDGIGVAKADQRGRLEVSFDAKTCKQTTRPYTNASPSPDFYADDKLAHFIESNKKGVIYVWSPRMGLSEKGIAEIKLATKNKKLPLLILLDKDVPKDEVLKLKGKYGPAEVNQADSFELKMRGASQHFPAVLVFKNKMITTKVKYGYEKASGYESDLRRMLK